MNLEDELTRALATIDQAKATYSQSQVRLEAVRRQSGSVSDSQAGADIAAVTEDARKPAPRPRAISGRKSVPVSPTACLF